MSIENKNKRCMQLALLLGLMLASTWVCAQAADRAAKLNRGGSSGPNKVNANSGASSNTSTTSLPSRDASFIIGTADVLAINVWKETEISRVVPVRSDGKISLPLVGELQASGRTPKQLEDEISARLKDYISEPQVTVIVQEIRSQKFNVLGMVMRPGSYPLTKPMTVIDAIAMAGGFRDFAKQKDIYVLRRNANGKQIRLPFNYKEAVKGQSPGQNVELEPNDSVIVP